MGVMRFRVYPPERITQGTAQQAYLSGIDGTAWTVRTEFDGEVLSLQRPVSDSARLSIPWHVKGIGPLTIATGSLVERPEPYLLPLELARGVVFQLREQLFDWQMIGLSTPKTVPVKLAAAVEQLSCAAVAQDAPETSSRHAEASLQAALDAAGLLTAAYADQSLNARRRGGDAPIALLGADLGAIQPDDALTRLFLPTFNAACVPLAWRETETTEGHFSWRATDAQIEWCCRHGLKVFAGPLLLLDPNALPDWLYLFEDDFESVQDFFSAFLRAAVTRYRGRVDYWIGAGRLGAADILSLTEQEQLQLAARSIQLIRSLDPDTPVLASFDQPWAEYMRQRHSDFPPLHFADTLIRAGLDFTGLMLEVNAGYFPGGTYPRHVVDFSRQLDAWSALGLPMWLSVSASSNSSDDPLSHRKWAAAAGVWTPATQQTWVARFVPLALAKPLVRGVLWSQLSDGRPHEFPHAGLFDAAGRLKPALRTLAAIRKKYLNS